MTINKAKEKISTYKKPFLILTIIFLIGIYPIIRANYNYIDDIGRVAHGYKGWENFSRYISCFLSNFIHADSYLTDISPLPQIIAIILLSISGLIILHALSKKKTYTPLELISIIPLGLSPYFLECLSYKYDSPYMALSVLASLIPIIFYNKKETKYLITIIISTLIVCMTYQASTGIFPMIVIIISFNNWLEKKNTKDILKKLLTSISGYLIGLIIFKTMIMHPVDTYVSNSIPELTKLFPTIFNNLTTYFNYIITDFKIEWLILIGFLLLGYIYTSINNSKQNILPSIIFSITTIILMLLLSFGMYTVLETPGFHPRAMYGFGVFITLIGSSIMLRKKEYIQKLVYLLLCWFFFVFSLTYGNSLYIQKEYTTYRTNLVLNDLKNIKAMMDDTTTNIQITGTIGLAPVIKNMPQDYKILNRLIPITFCNSTYMWGISEFENYYNIKNINWDNDINTKKDDLPLIQDTMYHTIKGNERDLLIILK